jgi:FdhD protein
MARPAAPGVRVRKWSGGEWSEAPDAVVTEEPLQLMLDGVELSVVMRTPGEDIELAAGLMFAEGVVRSREEIRLVRISAESGESEAHIPVEASIVESNQVDVHLSGAPRRKPERSMLSSSACGVCGAVMIDDLKRDLAVLPAGPAVDPALLPSLVERLRSGQGVFERTGGLHAAGLFDPAGELICMREDVGRHNAVDKVIGSCLERGLLPLDRSILMVSGRTSFEIVQKALMARIPVLVAVSAPSSLARDLAQASNQTLVGFLRGRSLNVYSGRQRIPVSSGGATS